MAIALRIVERTQLVSARSRPMLTLPPSLKNAPYSGDNNSGGSGLERSAFGQQKGRAGESTHANFSAGCVLFCYLQGSTDWFFAGLVSVQCSKGVDFLAVFESLAKYFPAGKRAEGDDA